MKKYLIDSDILIYFLKGDQKVVEKLTQIPSNELYTSRINYTELLYGAYNSTKIEKNLDTIIPFLKNFQILEFDEQSALYFAKIKAKLKRNGTIIADMDLMIASIAISNNCSLITNNLKHFERIEGLNRENL